MNVSTSNIPVNIINNSNTSIILHFPTINTINTNTTTINNDIITTNDKYTINNDQ